MKREAAYRAVRVGILPFSATGGVVDRKNLNDGLAGRRGPVHYGVQVTELSDAEVVCASKREDRNHRACSTKAGYVEFLGDVFLGERASRNRAVYPVVHYLGAFQPAVYLSVMSIPFDSRDKSVAHN